MSSKAKQLIPDMLIFSPLKVAQITVETPRSACMLRFSGSALTHPCDFPILTLASKYPGHSPPKLPLNFMTLLLSSRTNPAQLWFRNSVARNNMMQQSRMTQRGNKSKDFKMISVPLFQFEVLSISSSVNLPFTSIFWRKKKDAICSQVFHCTL